MTEHTKGHWNVDDGDLSVYVVTDDDRIIPIFEVHADCDGDTVPYAEMVANAHIAAAGADMFDALLAAKRLIDEALPKLDWGKSALDANAIQLLNQVPGEVNRALAKAKGA